MITTILLSAIGLAVLLQPNAPRFFAALMFASATLSHELFLSHLDGLMYYGSAALIDLAIIILTSGINPVPKMVIALHRICTVSIIANFAGWVMWSLYLPPLTYDLMFMVIYAYTLIILIRKDGVDVGGYGVDSWRSCFHFDQRARAIYSAVNGSKA